MLDKHDFDPVWERKYSAGHAQRYPWDAVVSFVFRYGVREDQARSEVRILEVGCGTGSNLWFAAREGFSVAGIDGSESAIRYARKRFEEEGLEGDLRVGNFKSLPFEEECFDLAIDRAALTCVGRRDAETAVRSVHRVLRPGGKLFFNPYSDRHSSMPTGQPGTDGLVTGIRGGTLLDVGQICFYGAADIDKLFSDGWLVLAKQHVEFVERSGGRETVHAEWRLVCEKS